ncbi:alpha/beta hydrolase [Candidatus Saccharibacteria bacterium]|nr:alpha/beta hydrolase [Candidatus Saccharibacteria bacterium]
MFKKLILKKGYDSKTKSAKLTVVCLHGIATDSHSWQKAIKFLKGTYSLRKIRFIAFDWLGYGKSSHSHSLKYDYEDQLTALSNALAKIDTPIVLVGHSLGTLLAARYAFENKKATRHLILLSPPVYNRDEIKFIQNGPAKNLFYDKLDKKQLKNRAFNAMMENIVFNIKNQNTFEKLTVKTDLIYGDEDQLISAKNLSALAKRNKKYLNLVKTHGHHGITRVKYNKIIDILEEIANEAL